MEQKLNTNSEFGAKIKAARKNAKISQSELAERLGKNLRTIQKYESGEIQPSIFSIGKIAEALGITSEKLFGYGKEHTRLDTLSDLIFIINELNKKTEVQFEIEIRKPPENDEWSCTLRFDGHCNEAKYNADLCLFLERYQHHTEMLETYATTQERFDEWLARELDSHETLLLREKPVEYIPSDEVLRRFIATHPEFLNSVKESNDSDIDK